MIPIFAGLRRNKTMPRKLLMYLAVGITPHHVCNGCPKVVLEPKTGMEVQVILILTKVRFT